MRATIDAPTWPTLATEAQLQETMRVAALRCGFRAYHTHNSRHSDKGFPDLILIRDGVLLVFELKAQKGNVRPMQREWIDAFNTLGFSVRAAIVRPIPKAGEISFDAALRMIEGGNE